MKTRKPMSDAASLEPATPAAKASAPLAEEIAKNEAPAPKRFTGTFPSAQPQAKPEVSRAMQRIVETTFLLDEEIDAAAKRLVQDLAIGAGRSDHGTVIAHLDRAEENARLAHRLMVTAKMQKERYDLDAAPLIAGMRDGATAELQAEKAKGERNKTITDADVESRCVEMYRDEWSSIRYEQRQLDLTVKNLEHQVENWASRCRTLQTIASKLR